MSAVAPVRVWESTRESLDVDELQPATGGSSKGHEQQQGNGHQHVHS